MCYPNTLWSGHMPEKNKGNFVADTGTCCSVLSEVMQDVLQLLYHIVSLHNNNEAYELHS